MPNGICPFTEWRPVGSHTYNPGSVHRVGFCDHTAGGFYSTLRNQNFWNEAGYSVHFAIARDGRATQLVNIFDRAFGQGRLGPTVRWEPYLQMGRMNPNEYLISTEHEDAILVNGQTQFVPGPTWTDAMYETDRKIKRWCIDEVRRVRGLDLLVFGEDSLTGHYMFDGVNRANCPGSPWRNDYRARLYTQLATGEDEVRIEHPRQAGFLTENAFNDGQDFLGEQAVNAAYDFELPPEAKFVELKFEARNGFCRVYSGHGNFVGDVGWGRPKGEPSTSTIIVGLADHDNGKWFKIHADDKNNPLYLFRVVSTAYYT